MICIQDKRMKNNFDCELKKETSLDCDVSIPQLDCVLRLIDGYKCKQLLFK